MKTAAIILPIAALAAALPSSAVTIDWIGPATGSWNDADNWNLNVVPDNNGQVFDVQILTPNTTVSVLSPVTVDSVLLNPSSTVDILNGDLLEINGGNVTNGTINISSTGATSTLRAVGTTPVTLQGGTINLGNIASNRLEGSSTTSGFINIDTLIRGSGTIIDNAGGFDNRGIIQADQSVPLIIDPATGIAMINSGTLQADNGATLQIISGEIDNGGGLIRAINGSQVRVINADINNGTLEITGNSTAETSIADFVGVDIVNTSGAIEVSGSTTVTSGSINNPVGSVINIQNGSRLEIDASTTVNNVSDINILSSGTTTTLRATGSGTVLLQGGGSVLLSNSAANRIEGDNSLSGFVNVDQTISGSGTIIDNSGSFENQSVIIANQSTPLIIDPATGIPMINSGILRASSGATLRFITGDVTNTGGQIIADDGTRLEFSSSNITDGTITLGAGVTMDTSTSTFAGVSIANSTTSTIEVTGNTEITGGSLLTPAGSAINIENGSRLRLDGTTAFNNGGTINLSSTGVTTTLQATGNSPVMLQGGGTINLTSSAANRIEGQNSSAGFVNVDHLIRGSGTIIDNAGSFENQAIIRADQVTPLIIDPDNTQAMVNSGMLQSTNGATLRLINGTIENAGGQILADTGSNLEASGIDINNGNLTLSANSKLTSSSSIFTGVTLANSATGIIDITGNTNIVGGSFTNPAGGVVNIEFGDALRIDASTNFVNGGDIFLNSNGTTTALQSTGTGAVTFQGGGNIFLSDSAGNRIEGTAASNGFINVDNVISGAGTIVDNSGTFVNQHIIDANLSNRLIIDPSTGNAFVNTGTLRASNGGILRLINGDLTNSTGLIDIQNDSELELSSINIDGGLIQFGDNTQLDLTNSDVFNADIQFSATTLVNLAGTNVLGTLVTLPSGNQIVLPNGTTLGFQDGTVINNQGKFLVNGTTGTTNFRVDGATVTLQGGGELELNNDPQSRISSAAAGNRLINVDNRIFGGGSINDNLVALSNRGRIDATGTFSINLNDSVDSFNTGIMEAFSGGIFNFTATTINQDEGLGPIGIMSANEGVFNFSGSHVLNGQLIANGAGLFNFSGSSSLSGVSSSAPIRVLNGGSLTLANDFNNAGSIDLLGTTGTTSLVIGSPNFFLDGGGTITLLNDPQNRIIASASGNRLINVDNTISGGGSFGNNLLAITNESGGRIIGNVSTPLIIDAHDTGNFENIGVVQADGGFLTISDTMVINTDGFTNGSIEAINGGTLTIQSASTIDGGDVFASASSTINLNGGSLINGTLFVETGSQMRTTGGTNRLSGSVLNQGIISINNASSLTLDQSGIYQNQGEIQINGTTSTTSLIIEDIVTLDGGGTVRLNGDPQSRIVGANSNARLINQAGNTIRGGGNFGSNLLAIENHGLVSADLSGISLNVDPINAETITNTGVFTAENGGILNLGGTFDQTGGGQIVSGIGSNVVFNAAASVLGGSINGPGDVRIQNTTSFVSVENNAPIDLTNGNTLTLFNSFQNNGDLNIIGTTGTTSLLIDGIVTLDGFGTIALNDDPQSRIAGTNAATSHLINNSNTIRGTGTIGSDTLAITNRANIIFTGLNTTTLNVSDSSNLINPGFIEVSDNSTLTIFDTTIVNEESGITGIIAVGEGGVINTTSATIIDGDLVALDSNFDPLDDGVFRAIGPTTLQDLNLQADYEISNGNTLTLVNEINNTHEIRILGTTGNTSLQISGPVTLNGGGRVLLANDPQARISGNSAATSLLINEDNVITGSGSIGANSLGIINRSLIEITGSNAATLDVSNTLGMVNAGGIEVRAGSVLNITGSTITNQENSTLGYIGAEDGATVTIGTSTIIGGDLAAIDLNSNPLDDGRFRTNGTATLQNLNIFAPFDIQNGNSLILEGLIGNFREINVNGANFTTNLSVGNAGANLTGGGFINLADDPQSRINGVTTGNALINTDNTIRGGGFITGISLVNSGTIEASGTTALNVNTTDPTFVSNGVLRATGTGGFLFQENVTNDGGLHEIASGSQSAITGSYTQTNGGATLVDGTLSATTGIFNQAGTIGGSGNIVGDVFNDGLISPGSSPGQLDITGNLTLSSTSSMYFEIGGFVAGMDFDYVHVMGNAVLGGDIRFDVTNGFSPDPADSFIVLSSTFLTGNLDFANGSSILSDNALWSAQLFYGPSSPFNQNQIILANFTPVPEPSTYLLMALGGGMILWWMRRRRRA
ncbi:MAG: PEP-CTERM sorting domain-containing protein [Verrucomicrobiota bacterium]